ncbi:hypothetical protein [Pseudoalteromonas piscicida]|uniref:hypothetical protein n=1 Tax=Pseudoalteromonas piscicida TaxID=43662 RepID=UPI001CB88190|nr:hypothetical protein [Pseudoalteromonas piscicida]
MSAVRLMHHQMGLFWGAGVWLGGLCVFKLPWQGLFPQRCCWLSIYLYLGFFGGISELQRLLNHAFLSAI